MNLSSLTLKAGTLCAMAALVSFVSPVHSQQEDFTVLTRGPVHEAFAEPLVLNPVEGMVISQQPPDPVPEIPPEVKPEGEDVLWIPGYWSWDIEADQFIWISGVWRVAPPDSIWVPGYWTEIEAGFQWVPGFWTLEETGGVTYLPPPPQSLEEGPTSPSPGPEYVWAPGCWIWNEPEYAWRPGYWQPVPQGWVWVPAHYRWTLAGCIFVDGYWDYSLEDRGILFAPVVFNSPVYIEPAYVYTPSIMIHSDVLVSHLFTYPSYCHYVFGDYYDPIYEERYGILPWFDVHTDRHHHRHGHDHLFASLAVHFGHDWDDDLRREHSRRRSNRDLRPPSRWDGHRHGDHDDRGERGRHSHLASRFEDFSRHDDGKHRFARIDQEDRDRHRRTRDNFRSRIGDRKEFESQARAERSPDPRKRDQHKWTVAPQDQEKVRGDRGKRRPPKPEGKLIAGPSDDRNRVRPRGDGDDRDERDRRFRGDERPDKPKEQPDSNRDRRNNRGPEARGDEPPGKPEPGPEASRERGSKEQRGPSKQPEQQPPEIQQQQQPEPIKERVETTPPRERGEAFRQSGPKKRPEVRKEPPPQRKNVEAVPQEDRTPRGQRTIKRPTGPDKKVPDVSPRPRGQDRGPAVVPRGRSSQPEINLPDRPPVSPRKANPGLNDPKPRRGVSDNPGNHPGRGPQGPPKGKAVEKRVQPKPPPPPPLAPKSPPPPPPEEKPKKKK